VGMILAIWTANLLATSLSSLLPFGVLVFEPGPDVRVLLATMGFCVLSTLFFALGPAWKLTRPDLLPDLKERVGQDRSAAGSGRLRSPRNLLVVAQVSLSLVLLTAGGLFIRGAFEAAAADAGFPLDDALVAELDPSLIGFDETRSREVYRQVVERLRTLPGIEAVSLSSLIPFGMVIDSSRVERIGAEDDEESVSAYHYIVGDDYFEALGVPLLRGRGFTRSETETDTGSPVVIIDEPTARRLFPEEDPLGQQIRFAASEEDGLSTPLEIVGIVPGLRHMLFDQEPRPHIYVPFGLQYRANMHIHMRLGARDPDAPAKVLRTVRQEIRALDERLPVLALKTLRDHRDASLFLWLIRAGANVFTLFGVLALFLAVVGVYGVKAYLVTGRTREIGIRMALGATPANVLWLVLREGLVVTLVGLGLGLVLSLGSARLLSRFLYEVSASDPLVFLSAPLLLAAAALLASYLPARWATKVMPTTALRYE
jgi:predicted permease